MEIPKGLDGIRKRQTRRPAKNCIGSLKIRKSRKLPRELIYENAAFVSTVINGKAFKVGSKSNSKLGDMCASNHFVMSDEAMYDCRDIHESINGIDKVRCMPPR